MQTVLPILFYLYIVVTNHLKIKLLVFLTCNLNIEKKDFYTKVFI